MGSHWVPAEKKISHLPQSLHLRGEAKPRDRMGLPKVCSLLVTQPSQPPVRCSFPDTMSLKPEPHGLHL